MNDLLDRLSKYLPSKLMDEVSVALSAQPSPGGQAAPFPWENFPAYLIDKCEGDTISEEGLQQALAAMAKDERYCVAARQPVGEPVAYTSEAQLNAVRVSGDGIMSQRNAKWRIPLYTAPPAQAVDLGRFRKLASWVVNCAGHGINDSQRRMGEELLALIDSKK